jgi:hypothetical protein
VNVPDVATIPFTEELERELPFVRERIARADAAARASRTPEARAGAAADATYHRAKLVRLFAMANLPPSAEGLPLVVRLDRWLQRHGEEIGDALIDDLARMLDPRLEKGRAA